MSHTFPDAISRYQTPLGKASVQCLCCSGPCRKSGRFTNRNRTVQRFRCLRCNKTFSDSQPLDGLRVEYAKVVQIVKLFSEGCGVRAISRLTDCHTRTVLSVLETVGEELARFQDAKLRNINAEWGVQIDEIWSRVAIRQSRTTPSDTERGDFYTFLGLIARTKLIVSNYTGKRDYESTDTFAKDLASRIAGRVQITSDGWAAYPDTHSDQCSQWFYAFYAR